MNQRAWLTKSLLRAGPFYLLVSLLAVSSRRPWVMPSTSFASSSPPDQHGVSMPYGSFSGYFTNAELDAYVDDLSSRDPEVFLRPIVIGHSIEGREIRAFCAGRCAIAAQELGQQQESVVDAAPEIFFNAMIHGREPMSMAALVYFIEYLLAARKHGDSTVTTMLRHRDLWFVMNLNPDAYEANFLNAPNRCGQQRKNMRDSCKARKNKGGVDLNRNFPVCYDIDNKGSTTNVCQEDYRGESAFSEPEAQALRDFVEKRHFSVALSYHSFGRFINQPYMCKKQEEATPTIAKDLEFFKRFGDACTKDAPGDLNKLWEYGHPWDSYLYTVNGDASDWMYHNHGILAMAPEVGPECPSCKRIRDCDGFWPKQDQILSLAQETLVLNLQAARVGGPLLALAGDPVANPSESTDASDGPWCELATVSVDIENSGVRDVRAPVSVAIFRGGHQVGNVWHAPTDELHLETFGTATATVLGVPLCATYAEASSAGRRLAGARVGPGSGAWSAVLFMHDICTVQGLAVTFADGPEAPVLRRDGTPQYFVPCRLNLASAGEETDSIVLAPKYRLGREAALGGTREGRSVSAAAAENNVEKMEGAAEDLSQSDNDISYGALSYVDFIVWVFALGVLAVLLKVYCDRRRRYQRLYSTDAARAVVTNGFHDIIHGSGSSRFRGSSGGSGSAGTTDLAGGGFGSSSLSSAPQRSGLTAANFLSPGGHRSGLLADDPYALSSDDDGYSVASSNTDY